MPGCTPAQATDREATVSDMAMRFHHVQVSYPDGAEGSMREFYVGVLGLTEVVRPASHGTVGVPGSGTASTVPVEIHCSMEDAFRPSPKAHPLACRGRDLDRLAAAVESAGIQVIWVSPASPASLVSLLRPGPGRHPLGFQQG